MLVIKAGPKLVEEDYRGRELQQNTKCHDSSKDRYLLQFASIHFFSRLVALLLLQAAISRPINLFPCCNNGI
jgi:hypothetical protein